MTDPVTIQWHALNLAVRNLDQSQGSPRSLQQLSSLARENCPDLLARLPGNYTQVLHQVLDRLESSALFTEESCSFSQQDLMANLHLWLNKAHERLLTDQQTGQKMRQGQ